MGQPCRKRRYRDKLAARIALSRTARPGAAANREECRAYYCQPCRGWHLTSRK